MAGLFLAPEVQSQKEEHHRADDGKEQGKDDEKGRLGKEASCSVGRSTSTSLAGNVEAPGAVHRRLQVLVADGEVVLDGRRPEGHLADEDPLGGKGEVKLDVEAGAVVQVDHHLAGVLQRQVGHVLKLNWPLRPHRSIVAEPDLGAGKDLKRSDQIEEKRKKVDQLLFTLFSFLLATKTGHTRKRRTPGWAR